MYVQSYLVLNCIVKTSAQKFCYTSFMERFIFSWKILVGCKSNAFFFKYYTSENVFP